MTASPKNTTSTRSASLVSEASSTTAPTALPSDEALEVLLSPDGYYTYLSIPKPDPSTIGPPRYLDNNPLHKHQTNHDSTSAAVDLDTIKKNYRRLSLKHHPDRRTGDAETFRILHRAKVVLSSPKLRREYDLVGLDLEDDEEDHCEDDYDANGDAAAAAGGGASSSSEDNKANDKNNGENKNNNTNNSNNNGRSNSKTETVMGHLASATLAGILQMVVRTGLMGIVSVILSRYSVLVSVVCVVFVIALVCDVGDC